MIREAIEAARAQLVATLAVLDVALAALEQPEGCRHEEKMDISTQTTPGTWYCPACRASGVLPLASVEGGYHG